MNTRANLIETIQMCYDTLAVTKARLESFNKATNEVTLVMSIVLGVLDNEDGPEEDES